MKPHLKSKPATMHPKAETAIDCEAAVYPLTINPRMKYKHLRSVFIEATRIKAKQFHILPDNKKAGDALDVATNYSSKRAFNALIAHFSLDVLSEAHNNVVAGYRLTLARNRVKSNRCPTCGK